MVGETVIDKRVVCGTVPIGAKTIVAKQRELALGTM